MGAGTGAHHHRVQLTTSAGDLLPTAAAISGVKAAVLAAITADLANLPWPPGPEAHAVLDAAPYLALALLEAGCVGVPVPRLARCLGLDPLDGPDHLAALRASAMWPGTAFRAASAVLEGRP